GRLTAGLGRTYTTIASIIKYPCEAGGINKDFKHRKKYGFFQSEIQAVCALAGQLGLRREDGEMIVYQRHPFVYLVEAADDICYSIIDMEDAHRLGILSHELVKHSFFHVIDCLDSDPNARSKTADTYTKIEDLNEKISYLRAKAINLLTIKAAEVFWNNRQQILEGTFNDTLVEHIERSCGALEEVMKISAEKIYNHDTVLEIEIAGYNVMSELLTLFIPALLKKTPDHKDKKVLRLFPPQFKEFEQTESAYEKVLSAFDLVSGMTDLYATEMYRKLKGVDIPQHR
ncbi:MAG: deoxyguanosinetriphosphate triphosphohydrolase, partial [Segetibacter sp.]